jgi:branched-chain amino acid transport system substrate-binding protein
MKGEKMKKIVVWLVVIALAITISLTGVACKATTAAETTAAETTAAETIAAETTAAETTAAATTAVSGETFKVAYLTYLTGDIAYPSLATVQATRIAFEEVGKVIGRPVELVVVDSIDPTNQLAEAQKLMSMQGIKYFLGGYDHTPIPLARYVTDNGGIYFDTCGWYPDITEEGGRPGYFMMMPTFKDFSQGLVDYSLEWGQKFLNKQTSNLKIGVIIHTGMSSVGDAIVQGLKDKNCPAVVVETYGADLTDFTSIITKLKNANVDIVIPCQISADATNFRKQCVSMNYNPPVIFGSGVAYDQAEFANMGDPALGCMTLSYTSGGINEASAPGLKEFKDKFLAQNGFEPLTHCLQMYTGAKVFLQAVDAAGADDVTKIEQALKNLDIKPGNLPNYWGIKFNDVQANIYAKPFAVGQWLKNDKGNPEYKVVYPKELAIADPIIPYFK